MDHIYWDNNVILVQIVAPLVKILINVRVVLHNQIYLKINVSIVVH